MVSFGERGGECLDANWVPTARRRGEGGAGGGNAGLEGMVTEWVTEGEEEAWGMSAIGVDRM